MRQKVDTKNDTFDTKTRVERRKNGKWKFAKRFGLNLAWQHNLYIADNLEGMANLNNTYDLNGSNILNFDVTSQLTLGIVFEFAKEKAVCRTCYY